MEDRGLLADDTSLSLSDVAELVGGRVVGDPTIRILGVAPLGQAGQDQLGLLSNRRYLKQLGESGAGALLVSSQLAGELSGFSAVVTDDTHAALTKLLARFHPPLPLDPVVHPTAVLGGGLTLGEGVRIDAYAVIEDGCELGDDVWVGAHVVLGQHSRVGAGSRLHPHVVLYPHTILGRRVIVHAGARLGSDGFGYASSEGSYQKVPQVGRCVIEDDVEIGANSCVDRGSIGDTVVGKGSKLDNLVHIAHNVRIGPDCAFAALVGIAGSTHVGAGVAFGGQAGAVGHIEIGDGATIGAQAGVLSDLPAGETVTGYPARDKKKFLRAAGLMLKLPELAKRVRALETIQGRGGPRSEVDD